MTAAPGRAWGSLSPTLRLRPRPGRGTGTGSRFPRFYLQGSVYLSDCHRVANESCCELNLVRVSCISRSNRREVGEHVPRGPGSRSARAAWGSRRRLPRGRPAAKPASLTPPGHLATWPAGALAGAGPLPESSGSAPTFSSKNFLLSLASVGGSVLLRSWYHFLTTCPRQQAWILECGRRTGTQAGGRPRLSTRVLGLDR